MQFLRFVTFQGRLKLTICWAAFEFVAFSGTTTTDYLLNEFSDV